MKNFIFEWLVELDYESEEIDDIMMNEFYTIYKGTPEELEYDNIIGLYGNDENRFLLKYFDIDSFINDLECDGFCYYQKDGYTLRIDNM